MEQAPTAVEIKGSTLTIPTFTPENGDALTGEILGPNPEAPVEIYSVQAVPHPERLKVAATLQQNDVGLGQRIALHFKERLAYVVDELSGESKWHVYNDQTGAWEQDPKSALARELAIQVTNSLNDELAFVGAGSEESASAQRKLERAQSMPEGEIREKAIKAAESALARAEGASMTEHLKFIKASNTGAGHWVASLQVAEGLLRRSAAEFDVDPTSINTPSGLLNLRTLELLPHSPHNMVTRTTSAHYVPGARTADVDSVIANLDYSGHEGLAKFTQRYLGSGLTDLAAAKTVFYQNGVPDAAKSTVILAAAQALGMGKATGYAVTADARTFCRSNADANAADPKLHELRGARLVFADEADKAGLLGDVFKKWASGEPLTTRAMREMSVQWYPKGTLIMAGNGVIGLPADDAGVIRRFTACEMTKPVRSMDLGLRERLKSDEASAAIFAWLVQGAHEWLAEGATREAFCITEQMTKETARYVSDADPLADFVDECVDTAPGTEYLPVKMAVWKEIYAQWCETTHSKQLPARVLKNYLEQWATESSPRLAQHDGWAIPSKARLMMGIGMKKPDYAWLERRGHVKSVSAGPVLSLVSAA